MHWTRKEDSLLTSPERFPFHHPHLSKISICEFRFGYEKEIGVNFFAFFVQIMLLGCTTRKMHVRTACGTPQFLPVFRGSVPQSTDPDPALLFSGFQDANSFLKLFFVYYLL
jgi:hypothetical protein